MEGRGGGSQNLSPNLKFPFPEVWGGVGRDEGSKPKSKPKISISRMGWGHLHQLHPDLLASAFLCLCSSNLRFVFYVYLSRLHHA